MKLFNIFIIILIILINNNLAHAEAGLKYTQDNKIVSWHKENLTLCSQISNQEIKNINNYLQLSVTTWNDSGISPTINIGNVNCDIIILYNTINMNNNPLAVNKLTYDKDTGEIYSAEITINFNHDSEIGNGKNKKLFDVPSFVAHELGHSLGLGEDLEDNQSTMYYSTKRGDTSKRDLNQSDLNAISKVYNNKQSIEQLNEQQIANYGSCSFNQAHNKNYLFILILIFISTIKLFKY